MKTLIKTLNAVIASGVLTSVDAARLKKVKKLLNDGDHAAARKTFDFVVGFDAQDAFYKFAVKSERAMEQSRKYLGTNTAWMKSTFANYR